MTSEIPKFSLISQGWILAVWILAAKLPNSDLNFAGDFLVDFFLLFFPRKRPEKIHQKIPRKIHPGLCSEKFPSDFCRSLPLIISEEEEHHNFPDSCRKGLQGGEGFWHHPNPQCPAIARLAIPFESKLLPAVFLLLRIYFDSVNI